MRGRVPRRLCCTPSRESLACLSCVSVSRDPNLQQGFRTGLSWLNSHSQYKSGKAFLSLNPDQQVTLLESLAYKKKFRSGEEHGRKFFGLIRDCDRNRCLGRHGDQDPVRGRSESLCAEFRATA